MRLFLYQEHDSFLHRLNPLTKFAVNLPMWIVLSLVTDPVTPVVFVVIVTLALWWLGGISPLLQARLLWPFWALAFSMLISFAFFQEPTRPGYEVLWQLGPLRITDEGLLVGLSTSLRILALFSLSLLFVMTTDPVAFIQSLVQKTGISYRFGYGVLAAYRFVPMLATEVDQIRAAHHVRGFSPGWGPAGVWERTRAYAIPLLASAIRRADRVALAMDSRAFGAVPERTYFREQRFTWADLVFAIGSTCGGRGLLRALAAGAAGKPQSIPVGGRIVATLTRDIAVDDSVRLERRAGERGRSAGATAKVLIALAAGGGAWQIITAADPAKVAVQVLMAAGAALLVGSLLFANELIAILRGPLYVAFLVILTIWLVLAWGSTQWQWNLLPA